MLKSQKLERSKEDFEKVVLDHENALKSRRERAPIAPAANTDGRRMGALRRPL